MWLTQERLLEVLNYNKHTGVFTRVKDGARAGSKDRHGYTLISVDGKRYTAGRLAFLWMLGEWPTYEAEHQDGDPGNNRWTNLRDATQTQNLQNKSIQSNNSTGFKGVILHKPGKWRARIKVNSKRIHLGLFTSAEAAHQAYVKAAHQHFGEFARAN